MADVKISGLPASTTPLTGAEVLPVVQSGVTKQVSVANLTAGRDVGTKTISATNTSQRLATFTRTGSSGLLVEADNAGPILQPTTVESIQVYNVAGSIRRFRFRTDTGNLELGSGNLVIGTSGKGIDFSVTPGTGTSELFDDYEEGTWTPTYVDSDGALVYDASGLTSGFYTKIGNTVICQFHIQTFSITINGTGLLSLGGLPFTSRTLSQSFFTAGTLTVGRSTDFSSLNNPASGVVGSAATTVVLYKFGSDDPRTGTGTRVSAVMSTSGYDNEFWGTVIYEAA